MKPSILIITYYWPPSGGAAVQRWLSLANELAGRGWDVHVLTVDEKYATYQLYDESLVADIHPGITVHKTKTFEPFGLYKLLFGKNSIPKPAFADESKPSLVKKASRFVRGNFFIPDPRKGWKGYAVPKALDVIDRFGIKNVITAGPPHSTHFTGLAVRRQRPVRWIADFHDLWTDVIYYDMLYHLPVVKRLDRKLERTILEGADLVLTVGEKYKEKLLQKSKALAPEKIRIIRIGYDEGRFAIAPPPRRSTEFTITYSGSIADFYRPEVFFRALKHVVDRHPEVAFRLRFVGVLSQGIRQTIAAEGLQAQFEETGYLPHREAVAYLMATDVLLLVNPVTKDEDMVIPGKIYEYLAARKPIITITKKTAEIAAIVAACGSGATFERTDVTGIEHFLEDLLAQWQPGKPLREAGEEACVRAYGRSAIAGELATLLA
ncbi:MAG: glycosyltransferase [Chitinophagaceae bacterium]|nr:MAG: glycosyltransferase [Chitinophagaceae bacterium]